MLNETQFQLVTDFIKYCNENKSSSTQMIQYLLTSFVQQDTTNRVKMLLEYIPQIATVQVDNLNDKIYDYQNAVGLMMVDTSLRNRNEKYKTNMSTLIHACKAHFPSGECSGMRCKGEKEYFNNFIKCLKTRKDEFDYDSKEDWNWISNTLNCGQWMKKVIQHNIDENWEPKQ